MTGAFFTHVRAYIKGVMGELLRAGEIGLCFAVLRMYVCACVRACVLCVSVYVFVYSFFLWILTELV